MDIRSKTQLLNMTPMEIYRQQVKGVYDKIRADNKSLSYVPCQLGGIQGQQLVQSQGMVLSLTDFEVTNG